MPRLHYTFHGHSPAKGRSPTYTTWADILQRCNNPKNAKFYMYGGVGITVCERWRSFAKFLADMGERPRDKTIDRIDGTKGYYKENCKWSTDIEQQRNMKSNRWIEYNGETKCLTEWCEIFGLDMGTVWRRLKDEWPLDRVFEPVFMPNITYEVIMEVRKLREDNRTPYEDLARGFGLAAMTVWRICNDPTYPVITEGTEYVRGKKLKLEKLTQDVVAEIQRLRKEEKMSYARLGKRFEIGYGTARRICLSLRH